MAKKDKPAEQTVDADPALVLAITLDGETWSLRPADVTVALASALRLQSHGAWRVPTLMSALEEGAGPEEIAAVVFLARRAAGEAVTYDAVAAGISGASHVAMEWRTEGDA